MCTFSAHVQGLEGCSGFSTQCGTKTHKQVIKVPCVECLEEIPKVPQDFKNNEYRGRRVVREGSTSHVGDFVSRSWRMSSKKKSGELLKYMLYTWAVVSY